MRLYARFWTDALGDPKLRKAVREGAKNLVLLPWFFVWAKRADADGRIEIDGKPADPRDISDEIPNTTARKVARSLEELFKIGVLVRDEDGCFRFKAWEYRNSGRTSDSREAVAERVRKWRDRKKGERNASGNGGNALQRELDVTTVTTKRVESREKRGESREERVDKKAGSSERGSLPPAARDFGRHFYGAASADRKRDIKRQLVATLNGGARFRTADDRDVVVRAISLARLESKCREVITEGVRDHDKAIVVLLTKLNDTTDVTEGAAAASARAIARETAEGTQRLESALAWLKDNPEQQTAVDRQLASTLPENIRESSSEFAVMARESAYHALVITAWSRAGEPTPSGATSP